MANEVVLFAGRLGKQTLRVWLEEAEGGIRLLTHEIGPDLEQYFGKDELETTLEIDAAEMVALTASLREGRADQGETALELLAATYEGDSSATTRLRAWLTERGIEHRFTLV